MASKKSLEAAAATAGMFSKAPEESEKKAEQQATPKSEKVTFSVKIDSNVLKRWRTYASLEKYGDKGRLTEAALVEYMNRHKLTPEQQEKFDILCGL